MKAVILDRDGVINKDSPLYIKKPEEWNPIPGSLEAIADLTRASFRVFIATNQSGLGRGLFDETTLSAIHQKMHEGLEKLGGRIEKIFFCPHAPDAGCDCRKPAPGLLRAIANEYAIDLNRTPFVGDSYKDVQAAREVGCEPLLVLTGNGQKTLAEHRDDLATVKTFANLRATADYVIEHYSSV